MFAFSPNLGAAELIVLLIILSIVLLFGVAVVVGIVFVIRGFQKSPGDGASATLTEENRRLRDEVARLKGEKS